MPPRRVLFDYNFIKLTNAQVRISADDIRCADQLGKSGFVQLVCTLECNGRRVFAAKRGQRVVQPAAERFFFTGLTPGFWGCTLLV